MQKEDIHEADNILKKSTSLSNNKNGYKQFLKIRYNSAI